MKEISKIFLTELCKGKVDAHVLRPGFTEANWPKLKLLLNELLTKDQLDWVENYRDEFLKYQ